MCRPSDFPPYEPDRVPQYRRHPLNPSPGEEHSLHFTKKVWCYFCKKAKR
jgi:hypothetical protein